MAKRTIAGIGVLAMVLMAACGDEDEPTLVEEVLSESCADICERWDECRGPIDVDDCIDECEDASDSEVAEDQIDACDDCIDDGSCQEIDACWAACPSFPAMR